MKQFVQGRLWLLILSSLWNALAIPFIHRCTSSNCFFFTSTRVESNCYFCFFCVLNYRAIVNTQARNLKVSLTLSSSSPSSHLPPWALTCMSISHLAGFIWVSFLLGRPVRSYSLHLQSWLVPRHSLKAHCTSLSHETILCSYYLSSKLGVPNPRAMDQYQSMAD